MYLYTLSFPVIVNVSVRALVIQDVHVNPKTNFQAVMSTSTTEIHSHLVHKM